MFNYKNTRTTQKKDINTEKKTKEKCILKKCTVCSKPINKIIRNPIICFNDIPKNLLTNVCPTCSKNKKIKYDEKYNYSYQQYLNRSNKSSNTLQISNKEDNEPIKDSENAEFVLKSTIEFKEFKNITKNKDDIINNNIYLYSKSNDIIGNFVIDKKINDVESGVNKDNYYSIKDYFFKIEDLTFKNFNYSLENFKVNKIEFQDLNDDGLYQIILWGQDISQNLQTSSDTDFIDLKEIKYYSLDNNLNIDNKKTEKIVYKNSNPSFSKQESVLQSNRINRIKYQEILKSQSVFKKGDINAVNGEMPVSLYRTTYPNIKKHTANISKTNKCKVGFNLPDEPKILEGSCSIDKKKCVKIVLSPDSINAYKNLKNCTINCRGNIRRESTNQKCYTILGYKVEAYTTDLSDNISYNDVKDSDFQTIIRNTHTNKLPEFIEHPMFVGNANHWFKISAISEGGIGPPNQPLLGISKDIIDPATPTILNGHFDIFNNNEIIKKRLPITDSSKVTLHVILPDYQLNGIYPNNRKEKDLINKIRVQISTTQYFSIIERDISFNNVQNINQVDIFNNKFKKAIPLEIDNLNNGTMYWFRISSIIMKNGYEYTSDITECKAVFATPIDPPKTPNIVTNQTSGEISFYITPQEYSNYTDIIDKYHIDISNARMGKQYRFEIEDIKNSVFEKASVKQYISGVEINEKYYFNSLGNILVSAMKGYKKPIMIPDEPYVKEVVDWAGGKKITITPLCNNISYNYSINIENALGKSISYSNNFTLYPNKKPSNVEIISNYGVSTETFYDNKVYDVSDGHFTLNWKTSNISNNIGGDAINNYIINERLVSGSASRDIIKNEDKIYDCCKNQIDSGLLIGYNLNENDYKKRLDNTLINGNIYEYKVRSQNIADISIPSESLYIRPMPVLPPQKLHFYLQLNDSKNIRFNFSNIEIGVSGKNYVLKEKKNFTNPDIENNDGFDYPCPDNIQNINYITINDGSFNKGGDAISKYFIDISFSNTFSNTRVFEYESINFNSDNVINVNRCDKYYDYSFLNSNLIKNMGQGGIFKFNIYGENIINKGDNTTKNKSETRTVVLGEKINKNLINIKRKANNDISNVDISLNMDFISKHNLEYLTYNLNNNPSINVIENELTNNWRISELSNNIIKVYEFEKNITNNLSNALHRAEKYMHKQTNYNNEKKISSFKLNKILEIRDNSNTNIDEGNNYYTLYRLNIKKAPSIDKSLIARSEFRFKLNNNNNINKYDIKIFESDASKNDIRNIKETNKYILNSNNNLITISSDLSENIQVGWGFSRTDILDHNTFMDTELYKNSYYKKSLQSLTNTNGLVIQAIEDISNQNLKTIIGISNDVNNIDGQNKIYEIRDLSRSSISNMETIFFGYRLVHEFKDYDITIKYDINENRPYIDISSNNISFSDIFKSDETSEDSIVNYYDNEAENTLYKIKNYYTLLFNNILFTIDLNGSKISNCSTNCKIYVNEETQLTDISNNETFIDKRIFWYKKEPTLGIDKINVAMGTTEWGDGNDNKEVTKSNEYMKIYQKYIHVSDNTLCDSNCIPNVLSIEKVHDIDVSYNIFKNIIKFTFNQDYKEKLNRFRENYMDHRLFNYNDKNNSTGQIERVIRDNSFSTIIKGISGNKTYKYSDIQSIYDNSQLTIDKKNILLDFYSLLITLQKDWCFSYRGRNYSINATNSNKLGFNRVGDIEIEIEVDNIFDIKNKDFQPEISWFRKDFKNPIYRKPSDELIIEHSIEFNTDSLNFYSEANSNDSDYIIFKMNWKPTYSGGALALNDTIFYKQDNHEAIITDISYNNNTDKNKYRISYLDDNNYNTLINKYVSASDLTPSGELRFNISAIDLSNNTLINLSNTLKQFNISTINALNNYWGKKIIISANAEIFIGETPTDISSNIIGGILANQVLSDDYSFDFITHPSKPLFIRDEGNTENIEFEILDKLGENIAFKFKTPKYNGFNNILYSNSGLELYKFGIKREFNNEKNSEIKQLEIIADNVNYQPENKENYINLILEDNTLLSENIRYNIDKITISIAASNKFFTDENGKGIFSAYSEYTKDVGDLTKNPEYKFGFITNVNIRDYAFMQFNNIITIIFGPKINSIGNFSFKNCNKLRDISFGDLSVTNLNSIGNNAFQGCNSLKNLFLPFSLSFIGSNAFANCSDLSNITFDNDLSIFIDENAPIQNNRFTNCNNIKTITFGENIEFIMDNAFSVKSPSSTLRFLGKKISTLIFNSGVIEVGESAFRNRLRINKILFSDLQNSKLQQIKNYAFSQTGITSITLPNSINEMGEGVFYKCENLTTFQINKQLVNQPKNNYIEEIPNYCFYSCISLNIQENHFNNLYDNTSSIKKFGDYAFYNCSNISSLEDVLPSKLTTIGKSCFVGTNIIGKLETPQELQIIKENAFANLTDISEVILEKKITLIEKNAFYGCTGINSLTIKCPLNTLSENDNKGAIFVGCNSLTNINIYNEIINTSTTKFKTNNFIPPSCFSSDKSTTDPLFPLIGQSITDVNIYGVDIIGKRSFFQCLSLINVAFYEYDQKYTSIIEEESFSYSAIQNLTLSNKIQIIGQGAFSNLYDLSNIKFNCNLYEVINNNKIFNESGIYPMTITIKGNSDSDNNFYNEFIPSGLFSNSKNGGDKMKGYFSSGKYDDNEWIKNSNHPYSFLKNFSDKIKNVIINDDIKVIKDYAFADTTLETINLDNCESILYRAFYNSKLKKIRISNKINFIGKEAFSCPDLWKITFDNNLTEFVNIEKNPGIINDPTIDNNSNYTIDEIIDFNKNLANQYFGVNSRISPSSNEIKYEDFLDYDLLCSSFKNIGKNYGNIKINNRDKNIVNQLFNNYFESLTSYYKEVRDSPLEDFNDTPVSLHVQFGTDNGRLRNKSILTSYNFIPLASFRLFFKPPYDNNNSFKNIFSKLWNIIRKRVSITEKLYIDPIEVIEEGGDEENINKNKLTVIIKNELTDKIPSQLFSSDSYYDLSTFYKLFFLVDSESINESVINFAFTLEKIIKNASYIGSQGSFYDTLYADVLRYVSSITPATIQRLLFYGISNFNIDFLNIIITYGNGSSLLDYYKNKCYFRDIGAKLRFLKFNNEIIEIGSNAFSNNIFLEYVFFDSSYNNNLIIEPSSFNNSKNMKFFGAYKGFLDEQENLSLNQFLNTDPNKDDETTYLLNKYNYNISNKLDYKIIIPNGTSELRYNAFKNMGSFNDNKYNIQIPNTLSVVDYYVFENVKIADIGFSTNFQYNNKDSSNNIIRAGNRIKIKDKSSVINGVYLEFDDGYVTTNTDNSKNSIEIEKYLLRTINNKLLNTLSDKNIQNYHQDSGNEYFDNELGIIMKTLGDNFQSYYTNLKKKDTDIHYKEQKYWKILYEKYPEEQVFIDSGNRSSFDSNNSGKYRYTVFSKPQESIPKNAFENSLILKNESSLRKNLKNMLDISFNDISECELKGYLDYRKLTNPYITGEQSIKWPSNWNSNNINSNKVTDWSGVAHIPKLLYRLTNNNGKSITTIDEHSTYGSLDEIYMPRQILKEKIDQNKSEDIIGPIIILIEDYNGNIYGKYFNKTIEVRDTTFEDEDYSYYEMLRNSPFKNEIDQLDAEPFTSNSIKLIPSINNTKFNKPIININKRPIRNWSSTISNFIDSGQLYYSNVEYSRTLNMIDNSFNKLLDPSCSFYNNWEAGLPYIFSLKSVVKNKYNSTFLQTIINERSYIKLPYLVGFGKLKFHSPEGGHAFNDPELITTIYTTSSQNINKASNLKINNLNFKIDSNNHTFNNILITKDNISIERSKNNLYYNVSDLSDPDVKYYFPNSYINESNITYIEEALRSQTLLYQDTNNIKTVEVFSVFHEEDNKNQEYYFKSNWFVPLQTVYPIIDNSNLEIEVVNVTAPLLGGNVDASINITYPQDKSSLIITIEFDLPKSFIDGGKTIDGYIIQSKYKDSNNISHIVHGTTSKDFYITTTTNLSNANKIVGNPFDNLNEIETTNLLNDDDKENFKLLKLKDTSNNKTIDDFNFINHNRYNKRVTFRFYRKLERIETNSNPVRDVKNGFCPSLKFGYNNEFIIKPFNYYDNNILEDTNYTITTSEIKIETIIPNIKIETLYDVGESIFNDLEHILYLYAKDKWTYNSDIVNGYKWTVNQYNYEKSGYENNYKSFVDLSYNIKEYILEEFKKEPIKAILDSKQFYYTWCKLNNYIPIKLKGNYGITYKNFKNYDASGYYKVDILDNTISKPQKGDISFNILNYNLNDNDIINFDDTSNEKYSFAFIKNYENNSKFKVKRIYTIKLYTEYSSKGNTFTTKNDTTFKPIENLEFYNYPTVGKPTIADHNSHSTANPGILIHNFEGQYYEGKQQFKSILTDLFQKDKLNTFLFKDDDILYDEINGFNDEIKNIAAVTLKLNDIYINQENSTIQTPSNFLNSSNNYYTRMNSYKIECQCSSGLENGYDKWYPHYNIRCFIKYTDKNNNIRLKPLETQYYKNIDDLSRNTANKPIYEKYINNFINLDTYEQDITKNQETKIIQEKNNTNHDNIPTNKEIICLIVTNSNGRYNNYDSVNIEGNSIRINDLNTLLFRFRVKVSTNQYTSEIESYTDYKFSNNQANYGTHSLTTDWTTEEIMLFSYDNLMKTSTTSQYNTDNIHFKAFINPIRDISDNEYRGHNNSNRITFSFPRLDSTTFFNTFLKYSPLFFKNKVSSSNVDSIGQSIYYIGNDSFTRWGINGTPTGQQGYPLSYFNGELLERFKNIVPNYKYKNNYTGYSWSQCNYNIDNNNILKVQQSYTNNSIGSFNNSSINLYNPSYSYFDVGNIYKKPLNNYSFLNSTTSNEADQHLNTYIMTSGTDPSGFYFKLYNTFNTAYIYRRYYHNANGFLSFVSDVINVVNVNIPQPKNVTASFDSNNVDIITVTLSNHNYTGSDNVYHSEPMGRLGGLTGEDNIVSYRIEISKSSNNYTEWRKIKDEILSDGDNQKEITKMISISTLRNDGTNFFSGSNDKYKIRIIAFAGKKTSYKIFNQVVPNTNPKQLGPHINYKLAPAPDSQRYIHMSIASDTTNELIIHGLWPRSAYKNINISNPNFLKSIFNLEWELNDSININANITYYIGVRDSVLDKMLLKVEVQHNKNVTLQSYNLSNIFNDSHVGKNFDVSLYGKYGLPVGNIPDWIRNYPSSDMNYPIYGETTSITYEPVNSTIELISVAENWDLGDVSTINNNLGYLPPLDSTHPKPWQTEFFNMDLITTNTMKLFHNVIGSNYTISNLDSFKNNGYKYFRWFSFGTGRHNFGFPWTTYGAKEVKVRFPNTTTVYLIIPPDFWYSQLDSFVGAGDVSNWTSYQSNSGSLPSVLNPWPISDLSPEALIRWQDNIQTNVNLIHKRTFQRGEIYTFNGHLTYGIILFK